MTAMLNQLLKHPEAYEQACKTVSGVCNDSGQLPYENSADLDYIQAVMYEALRLEPSVSLEFKTAQKHMKLKDNTPIAPGDMVFYSPYVICRLRKLWGEDCDEFKPNRWFEQDDLKGFRVSDYKYPVFNLKARKCLGKSMATLEVKSLFASLLNRYKFELIPDQDPSYLFGATIAFKHGLYVKCRRI